MEVKMFRFFLVMLIQLCKHFVLCGAAELSFIIQTSVSATQPAVDIKWVDKVLSIMQYRV